MAGSTLHSDKSDGSEVLAVPVSELPDVDGCRNEGIPVAG